MMLNSKVLFLTDPAQDYGADYLYDGFCSVMGVENVMDWPVKASLHDGDQRVFDCDLGWSQPSPSVVPQEAELPSWCEAQCDLFVIPTLRGLTRARLARWSAWLNNGPIADRVVCCDFEDQTLPLAPLFDRLLGFRPVAHFKREVYPDQATEIIPFPLGYPARRVVPAVAEREPLAMYDVQVWPWARGRLRERLGQMLQRRFGSQAQVRLHYDGTTRRAPAEYHADMRKARIAVVPAGQGWFTNRLFEALADGCAVVAEAPTVAFPEGLLDGIECLYFRTEEQACDHVERLLDEPALARQIAEAGRLALLNRHTTAYRAEQIMRQCAIE